MSVTHDPAVAQSHGAGKQCEVLLTPNERQAIEAAAATHINLEIDVYGRAVRYSMSDLVAWLKACAKTSTAE